MLYRRWVQVVFGKKAILTDHTVMPKNDDHLWYEILKNSATPVTLHKMRRVVTGEVPEIRISEN